MKILLICLPDRSKHATWYGDTKASTLVVLTIVFLGMDAVKVELWDVVDEGIKEIKGSSKQVFDAGGFDVHQQTNGVIFLMDVTRAATMDYVVQQLRSTPTDLPVLVI